MPAPGQTAPHPPPPSIASRAPFNAIASGLNRASVCIHSGNTVMGKYAPDPTVRTVTTSPTAAELCLYVIVYADSRIPIPQTHGIRHARITSVGTSPDQSNRVLKKIVVNTKNSVVRIGTYTRSYATDPSWIVVNAVGVIRSEVSVPWICSCRTTAYIRLSAIAMKDESAIPIVT